MNTTTLNLPLTIDHRSLVTENCSLFTDHWSLPNLHFAHLRLHLKALAPLRLPAYPGSALRGGFGHAFRKVVCTMGPIPCDTCILRTACPYYQLFEAPVPANAPPLLQKTGRVPHAFIIAPDTDGKRHLQAGETFAAGLTLLGPAIRSLPYFLMAFQLFGRVGLGRNKAQFALAAAEAMSAFGDDDTPADGAFVPYFDGETGLAPGLPPILNISAFATAHVPPDDEVATIQIRLHTPLRLKKNGDLVTRLTPREFIYHLCRRISHVLFLYGEPAGQTWNFKPLLAETEKLQMRANLRWWDWQRYSARQQTVMNLGGLIGGFELSGEPLTILRLLPLLKVGEWMHVGKGTTFGLGKYKVTSGHVGKCHNLQNCKPANLLTCKLS